MFYLFPGMQLKQDAWTTEGQPQSLNDNTTVMLQTYILSTINYRTQPNIHAHYSENWHRVNNNNLQTPYR